MCRSSRARRGSAKKSRVSAPKHDRFGREKLFTRVHNCFARGDDHRSGAKRRAFAVRPHDEAIARPREETGEKSFET
jgi:hypothetical protein